METELKFRLGNRTDMTSQLTTAVQMAYDELVTGLKIPETEESSVLTLSTGTTTYTMPTDILFPVSVRNATDGERLEAMSIRNYDRIRDVATTGKPSHYVWWRNELIIVPPNDTTARTFLMRYRKRLVALSASTTLSALPREWDEVIIQGAYFRALDWLQLKQEGMAAKAEYMQMLQRRMDRLAEAQYDRQESAAPSLAEHTSNITSGWRR
jgi:hypothetical protein